MALTVKFDAPLRGIDFERRADNAGLRKGSVSPPKRSKNRIKQGTRAIAWTAIDGALSLFIGQTGGGPHKPAFKAVRALGALGVKHHAHGEARASLAFAERAQAGRERLGKHRLNPIWKVNAVALFARVMIQG
jgi:hypothetical protein